jgi:invasion protein IalB
MYNDTDERRRHDQSSRRSRYQAPHDEAPPYPAEDEAHQGEYADHQGGYDETDADRGVYQEQPEPLYEDPPAARRRLVPVLAIAAAVLIVAIGVGAALYFLGVFGGSDRPAVTAATPEAVETPALPDAPPAPDPASSASADAPATMPSIPTDGATEANPSVPDAVVSVAPPAQGEPPVRSVHDAWQVRCDTPAGAQGEQCVLMQFVTAEDRENVGLTVIVLKTADQKARIMRILAPLGVLLPSGLGLKIDDADIGRAGFVRCLPNGCVAEVILEDQLLGQLEKGKTATFIIFQTPEEGIGIPISLAGFGEGFSALP